LNHISKLFIFLFIFKITIFSYNSAVTDIIYKDEKRNRIFYTKIYYPTLETDKNEILVNDNKIFVGNKFQKDASIASEKFPLILLIHGSGGNNTSLNYLVADLTSKGIIVVATNYLSDDENIYPPETISVKPWIQNTDTSFLLDQILKEKKFTNNISKDSIGILGYSKGGYSALALVGGKLDYNKYINFCKDNKDFPDCIFYSNVLKDNRENFEKSYLDKRFSFAISIDPILSHSFTNESLANIKILLLLVSSDSYIPGNNEIDLKIDDINKRLDKKYVSFKLINDSGHFSFLPLCKKEAAEILENSEDEIICIDGKKGREQIHNELNSGVIEFLYKINILK
jgi:predicted dienelactone hydrolase